ncbi:MAG: hypothetical protein IPO59_15085 [Betaproteobacteria bacterium]|nr:hypothetical protein [Betaproteobacteria bacterium]
MPRLVDPRLAIRTDEARAAWAGLAERSGSQPASGAASNFSAEANPVLAAPDTRIWLNRCEVSDGPAPGLELRNLPIARSAMKTQPMSLAN